jgi:hypothetical protein
MIVRLYDDWWVILAQSEIDYKNKINKIKRGDPGDRKGFYTIKTAPQEIINQLK